MGMDTECDVAADAGGDQNARAGIRHLRDRLLQNTRGFRPMPLHAKLSAEDRSAQ